MQKELRMDKACGNCGNRMKFVKGGVSTKTGKPYTAFWSCPTCKSTENVTPATLTETNDIFRGSELSPRVFPTPPSPQPPPSNPNLEIPRESALKTAGAIIAAKANEGEFTAYTVHQLVTLCMIEAARLVEFIQTGEVDTSEEIPV